MRRTPSFPRSNATLKNDDSTGETHLISQEKRIRMLCLFLGGRWRKCCHGSFLPPSGKITMFEGKTHYFNGHLPQLCYNKQCVTHRFSFQVFSVVSTCFHSRSQILARFNMVKFSSPRCTISESPGRFNRRFQFGLLPKGRVTWYLLCCLKKRFQVPCTT